MAHAAVQDRRRRPSGPGAVRAGWAGAQLVLGTGLLGTAALAGLLLARRPGANRVDADGYFYLPSDSSSHVANEIVKLGSLPALVGGIVVIFLAAIFRDWVRAFVAGAAPAIAVLVVEHVAKPMVGRAINGGGYTYPSGTVTVVASLAAALLLVAPSLLRPLVLVLGIAAVAAVGVAVIVLRWHYPTDVVGGVCVGIGSVFFLDALAHLPFIVARATTEKSTLWSGPPARVPVRR